jgi:hypothetical protein
MKQRIEENGEKLKKQLQSVDGTRLPTEAMIYKTYEKINVGR